MRKGGRQGGREKGGGYDRVEEEEDRVRVRGEVI